MKQITPNEIEQRLAGGKSLNIIDVRETEEVAEGKIPGAVNIPLGLIEFRMHELDKNKEYVMVCRSGGRSGQACQFLDSHGFKTINMAGGMLAWEGKTE
ncbi:rhodanese-like domain-containing protein [Bacillus sp. FJAT-27245]|uniref:rhodanese-like domain-containing protein n=1 Tax=Bacillus sp. FJAT-27245 TaxID=1684144 RepID=UPI0006A7A6E7|nr:rhodanese-like domain-containing protein [Bacillus sp. FJAT-27245]